MSDITDLSDTIRPRSDRLNADDLLTGPMIVEVKSVARGNEQSPIAIAIAGYKPYLPCKSMRRVIITAWGKNGNLWIGRKLRLFADPSICFGPDRVGGIRISHMSDIAGTHSTLLTVKRGRREPFTVEPLDLPMYQQADFDKNFPAWQRAVEEGKITIDALLDKLASKGELNSDQKARVVALSTQRIIALIQGDHMQDAELELAAYTGPEEHRLELEAMFAAAIEEKS